MVIMTRSIRIITQYNCELKLYLVKAFKNCIDLMISFQARAWMICVEKGRMPEKTWTVLTRNSTLQQFQGFQ